MPKMEPAPTRLAFALTSDVVNGTHYIDLSQCASIVNRRFYRQGLNWAVAGFTVISTSESTGAVLNISKLQTTWTTSGSWEKSFRHWRKQQQEVLDAMGAEGVKARFNDYKIHMDTQHATIGFASNLIPWSESVQFLPGEEWLASEVAIPNDPTTGTTSEYFVKMYGPSDAQSKSIIGGYVFSRATPFNPDPETPDVATSWLNRMNDVGQMNDDVVDNARERNNELPYDQTVYPGQDTNGGSPEVVDALIFTNTTIAAKQSARGGEFPCGLIKLQAAGFTTNMTIYVDLVPGPERGYLTQPMMEM